MVCTCLIFTRTVTRDKQWVLSHKNEVFNLKKKLSMSKRPSS